MVAMAAARKVELSSRRCGDGARKKLRRLVEESKRRNDLKTWARARVVLGYVEGRLVADLAQELDVDRSTATRWVAAYAERGFPALKPGTPPGPEPKLNAAQSAELAAVIEEGPREAGFEAGIWTGRLVSEFIRERFGVVFHWKYVPQLLHRLGFSVQRPRKLLAKADLKAQAIWLRTTFPAIKKKRAPRAASSSSKTKRASSSTLRSTEPGPVVDSSRE
jgi:transposase